MGGRGANSGGKYGRAPRGYRTVGKVHGIPVIKSIDSGGKILPIAAKPNSQYLGMNKFGTVKQLRVYDENGNVRKDIDWSHPFEGHRSGTVHCHEWHGLSRTMTHSRLTKSEISKYREAIEEASGRKDLIWTW